MSYASVMVYTDAESDPKSRVILAAALAAKFNATLIGLCALAIRPLFLTEDFGTAEVTERDIEKMKAKIDRKKDWFYKIVGADYRRIEWRSVLDFPIEALAHEACSADLVVIGRTSALGDAYSSLNLGAALLRIGRPALIVPDGVSSLRADHILIGWKDTREARRATRDALPFLRKAARVTIVELSEVGEQSTAQKHINDVARYLERHGIKGDPQVLLRERESQAVQLTNVAQEVGADLLVTGAYGHSRLGEWFFGGITNDLLATSPICCLMSH